MLPCSPSAPLCNVKPRPGCDLPQTLRKLVLFLHRSLPPKYRKGENKAPLLTSRGGGKRRPGGLSPCRRPPSPPPCPCPPRRLRCPPCPCGELRGAADSALLGLAALGLLRGSCRADFQQPGSAPALPAEQTPRSRTHFFPQGGPGSGSASTIRSLSGTPAALGWSSAPAPRRCAERGETPVSFSDLRSENHFLYHHIFFPRFLFIFILFIPPVTVCGK